ncbi:MAG: ATPase, T2SS/T4P/T4SS family [Mariprofundaceae bacterium]
MIGATQQALVRYHAISESQLHEAKANKKKLGGSLLKHILTLYGVNQERVVRVLSSINKIPILNPKNVSPDKELIELCTEKLCMQIGFMPYKIVGRHLVIAMIDPLDLERVDLVGAKTNKPIHAVFITPANLDLKLQEWFGGTTLEFSDLIDEEDCLEAEPEQPSVDLETDLKRGAEESPIIQMVNKMLIRAMRTGSSDLHIEPAEEMSTIRSRIDGKLWIVSRFKSSVHSKVAARIKIMAGLDIANSMTPQDGRARIKFSGRVVDLRISMLPAIHGETIVVRLLDKDAISLDIEKLGFEPDVEEKIKAVIHQPTGAVLATGPTGSGKSTLLYSFVKRRNSEDANIITVEDPVEYEVAGINQINVNEKTGLTFPAALKSILRQDPDVVMVGEIRDQETASIALKAAQTGHMVFSTLHTNDAPSTITRLEEMGIERSVLASSLSMIINQRLMRRLCPHCKVPAIVDSQTTERFGIPGGITFYKGKGCSKCMSLGYAGRIGIYEMLMIDDEIELLITNGASGSQIREAAQRAGMRTLFEDAISKAMVGLTSLEEVERNIPAPVRFDLAAFIRQKTIHAVPAQGRKPAMTQPARAKPIRPRQNVVPLYSHAVHSHATGLPRDPARTVLVVDASTTRFTQLSDILEATGKYQAAHVKSGEEAWKQIFAEKPRLIIANYDLPGISGFQLVDKIRKHQSMANVPVLLLTEEQANPETLNCGADAFIPQPLKPAMFLAQVNATMGASTRMSMVIDASEQLSRQWSGLEPGA